MTNYTLKREVEIAIVYDDTVYHLDALTDYEFSQTFSKRTYSRKTLHTKTPFHVTKRTKKNKGDVSLLVQSTDTFIEGIFLTLIGFTGDYQMPDNLLVEPIYFDIIITTPTRVTHLSTCVLTAFDVSFSKGASLQFRMGVEFGDQQIVTEDASSFGATEVRQGNNHDTTAPLEIEATAHGEEYTLTAIRSFNFSLQQSVTWRQDQSIHNIGNMHTVSRAVLTDLLLNTVLTLYLKGTDTTDNIIEDMLLVVIYGFITITLTNVTLSRRETIEDVLSVQYDIALQDNSSVDVEYGA